MAPREPIDPARDLAVAVATPGLLRVTFLGVFSGFYVAIYAVTDHTYREQFFVRVAGELRQTFAVRAAYLSARRA